MFQCKLRCLFCVYVTSDSGVLKEPTFSGNLRRGLPDPTKDGGAKKWVSSSADDLRDLAMFAKKARAKSMEKKATPVSWSSIQDSSPLER